ncbi:MAG TPA: DUF1080 domain-containing protein [Chthoniobacteraceae bacterium]
MSPRLFAPAFLIVLAGSSFAAEEFPTFINPADAGPDYAVQGEYVGENCGAQVVALGEGKFRIIGFSGGLPGAVEEFEKKVEVEAAREGDKITFNQNGWSGSITAGVLVAKSEDGNTWELKKTLRESPTLGAKPPAGATVLFSGAAAEAWEGGKVTKDGLLEGGTKTKASFGDCTLHAEFRTPFMPTARRQARGNSGIYLQDRYEAQVLDSFGTSGESNEAGGIYSKSKPRLNMCFPPLTWQTYDIDFQAARFDANGTKTKNAVMTVKLNGVLVQDQVEVDGTTTSAGRNEGPEPGPIQLQNHGNPVLYRNIWIVEKK